MDSHCYVIAEAGVNHNGCIDTALKMVEVAADCGANAIKFQTFIPEKLVCKSARTVDYQKNHTGKNDQLSMLQSLVLKRDMHSVLIDKCEECNIEFLSTPFDESSATFLVESGVKKIKIPSGEITNLPLLEHIANSGLPIILSTGMSNLYEVKVAVECIEKIQGKLSISRTGFPLLSVLHCTSNYPTSLVDVNLKAMQTMRDDIGLPVGYSDHTLSSIISPVAVGMGASIIEKHFTLDRKQDGPDHAASLTPGELRNMISMIREVETALGSGIKEPRISELPVRDLVRKSIVLNNDVMPDEVIKETDLVMLRPGTGIQPSEIKNVLGKRATRKLIEGEILALSDFS